jgi:hypothetical protein
VDYEPDSFRGTGRTTKQILAAPENAVYVWPVSGSMYYIKYLVLDLGRADLKIVSLEHFCTNYHRGLRAPVVVDHACWQHASDRTISELYRILDYRDSRGLVTHLTPFNKGKT